MEEPTCIYCAKSTTSDKYSYETHEGENHNFIGGMLPNNWPSGDHILTNRCEILKKCITIHQNTYISRQIFSGTHPRGILHLKFLKFPHSNTRPLRRLIGKGQPPPVSTQPSLPPLSQWCYSNISPKFTCMIKHPVQWWSIQQIQVSQKYPGVRAPTDQLDDLYCVNNTQFTLYIVHHGW